MTCLVKFCKPGKIIAMVNSWTHDGMLGIKPMRPQRHEANANPSLD